MLQRSLVPLLVAGFASLADAQMTFHVQVPFPTQGVRSDSIAIGDFDQHNGVDFAVTSGPAQGVTGQSWIQVFHNLGNGTFASMQVLSLGQDVGVASLVSADFDGDNDLDLAASLVKNETLQLFVNSGGQFVVGATLPLSGVEMLAVGDIDGDDDVDLIATTPVTDNLVLLSNDAHGTFTMPHMIKVGAGTRALALEDLNGDGRTDIAVTTAENRSIDILFSLGAGAFAPPISIVLAGSDRPKGLVASDLDGDGDVDLATTTDTNNFGMIVVFENQGEGTFVDTSYASSGNNPDVIVAGDFDGDGHKDLATADESANSVSVLPNLGSGEFGNASTYGVGVHPVGLARADFDGNGSLDLITANRSVMMVSVLLNGTQGGTDNFCVTSSNSAGFGTRIDSVGSVSLARGTFTLLARSAPANTPGIFFQGNAATNAVFGNGRLCVTGGLVRLPVVMTNDTGHASSEVHALSNEVGPGATRYYQFWHRDVGSSGDFSDGLRATFNP